MSFHLLLGCPIATAMSEDPEVAIPDPDATLITAGKVAPQGREKM
jgi:hypothetical protein